MTLALRDELFAEAAWPRTGGRRRARRRCGHDPRGGRRGRGGHRVPDVYAVPATVSPRRRRPTGPAAEGPWPGWQRRRGGERDRSDRRCRRHRPGRALGRAITGGHGDEEQKRDGCGDEIGPVQAGAEGPQSACRSLGPVRGRRLGDRWRDAVGTRLVLGPRRRGVMKELFYRVAGRLGQIRRRHILEGATRAAVRQPNARTAGPVGVRRRPTPGVTRHRTADDPPGSQPLITAGAPSDRPGQPRTVTRTALDTPLANGYPGVSTRARR